MQVALAWLLQRSPNILLIPGTSSVGHLRENLGALKGSAEERSLVKRYTAELNTQEDSLGTLRRDLSALQQQRDAAANDLKNRIESLTLDERVGG